MTISSETRTAGPFTGNGVTVAFPFAFKVFSSADLLVVITDTTNIESTLVLTTEYSVSLNSDQDNNPGGTVTTVTAPGTDYLLTITSQVGNLQPVALTNSGGFYPTVLNDEFDRLTILVQQLAEKLGRSLTTPISSSVSPVLPAPAAGSFLAWNSSETALVNQQVGSGMLLREIINVNDSPYDGDIQAAVTANPGKLIWLPPGAWTISAPILVSADYTRLMGAGAGITWINQSGSNVDAIQFQPTNTTNGTFLNFCGLSGVYIYNTTAARTAGAGVRLTQCNGFIFEDVVIANMPEGLTVAGGQLNIFDRFKIFGSTLSGTPVANSAAIKFTNQQSGAGYQQAFTSQISNFIIGDNKRFADGILIEGADGLNFSNGYVSRTANYLFKIKPNISGKHVSSVMVSTTYFDGNNQTTGTANGIGILDDGFAGASLVNDVVIDSTVKVGNLVGKGIYSTHPNLLSMTADPTSFYNCAGTEVDVSSGMTTGIVGLWCPWTPAITCTTPGNLSVTYSEQTGRWMRSKDGMVTAQFNIQTSAFTHTTASGNWTITGLPVSAATDEFGGNGSVTMANGVDKAGYHCIAPLVSAGLKVMTFRASTLAGGWSATVVAADIPSGASLILIGHTSYAAGEIY